MGRQLRTPRQKRPPSREKQIAPPAKSGTRGTAPLTEEETVALFLSDLIHDTPGSNGTGDGEDAVGSETRAVQSMEGGKLKAARGKKKLRLEVNGPSRETGQTSVAATQVAARGRVEMSLPLEEGEEDSSVSVEVLQQAAAFLSGLSSAQSQQFWALRQVARGEKEGRSVPKLAALALEEDEVEGSASSSNCDSDGSSDEETREVPHPPAERNRELKGKRDKTGKNGGRGGALFKCNPDVWDD